MGQFCEDNVGTCDDLALTVGEKECCADGCQRSE